MAYVLSRIKTIIIVCVFLFVSSGKTQECNGGAECITLKSCTSMYTQLQNHRTPELVSLLRSLHCGFDNGRNPKICCPPQSLFSRTGDGNSQTVDEGSRSLLPNSSYCGIYNNDRIVGGTRADLDEHPWMALLRYDKPNGSWGFYCGGVLISSRYVMTAAHCVVGAELPKSWTLSGVRLGEYDTEKDIDCLAGDCAERAVDVPVQTRIPHEGYNPEDKQQYNDLALLRLAKIVRFTDFIKPICLPTLGQLRRLTFEDFDMEVAGWGKTESRSASNVKLKVKVPVVTNEECNTVYRKVERRISANQICAGGRSGQDSCRGDSGGPLMSRVPPLENWFAIGIVSYGPTPCGTRNWPGVYTRITAYTDWIVSKLQP